jgi:hypothetical protein
VSKEEKVVTRTMGDCLNLWGRGGLHKSQKKPTGKMIKHYKERVKKEYPSIVKKVKAENAIIHWGDETGIRNTSQYGRSYKNIN